MLQLEQLTQAARRVANALLDAPAVGVAVAFFHAQQAAEKALKAVMCLRGLEYRRTHDLEGAMSTPGRPKGEYRSAQHEGTPVSLTLLSSWTAPRGSTERAVD